MSTDSNGNDANNGNKTESDILTNRIIEVSIQEKEEKEARIIETKKEVENRYYGIKKPLIEQLKDALIKEGFGNKTVIEICRRLRGYVTEPYIRKIVDDPELKDQSKVRTKQEVAQTEKELEAPMMIGNDGNTITDNDDSNDNDDNEVTDKYYANKPKLANPTPSPTQRITNDTGLVDLNDKNEYQINIDIQKENQELKAKLNAMEQEKILHTTVRLNKSLFQKVSNYINDRAVKQVLLDFDDNMQITNVRAIL